MSWPCAQVSSMRAVAIEAALIGGPYQGSFCPSGTASSAFASSSRPSRQSSRSFSGGLRAPSAAASSMCRGPTASMCSISACHRSGCAAAISAWPSVQARCAIWWAIVQPSAGVARAQSAAGRSATTLQASMAALDRSAAIPGTSWGVDTAAHQVVVTADSTVTGAKLDQLKAAMAKLGSTARLERTAGTMTPFIAGGDAITGGGFRCSLGFNVTRGGQAHLLTAGHCGNVTTTWSAGGQVIASRVNSQFPGNDFSIFRFTANVSHPSSVDLYNGTSRAITRAANATVGQSVTRSGSTSHVHSGRVTALNVTVHYSDGSTVTGLIQ